MLLNEVKNFIIKKDEDSLRGLERQVHKLIKEIMPAADTNYKLAVKRIDELRLANKNGDKPEQQFKNPRKKFPWDDNLRYGLFIVNLNLCFNKLSHVSGPK